MLKKKVEYHYLPADFSGQLPPTERKNQTIPHDYHGLYRGGFLWFFWSGKKVSEDSHFQNNKTEIILFSFIIRLKVKIKLKFRKYNIQTLIS